MGRKGERVADRISKAIERPISMNNDALADHLKAIGEAIIDDAKHLSVDTNRLRMVRVEAEIAPCEQITTLTYTLERTADPRFQKQTEA